MPPKSRSSSNPWPLWPRVFRVEYGHEEVYYLHFKEKCTTYPVMGWTVLHGKIVLADRNWPVPASNTTTNQANPFHRTKLYTFDRQTTFHLLTTSVQVVKTSIIINSPFQDNPHPDDQTIRPKGHSVVACLPLSMLGSTSRIRLLSSCHAFLGEGGYSHILAL